MATGALSSLGIGSNGTLSYDVIDQLRSADEDSIIKPIERNLVSVNEKQAALTTLEAQIASFNDSIEELSDSTLFANREVSVSGDSVSVTANAGVDVQDMDIEVTQLAKNDVHESVTTYNDRTSKVATGPATVEINAGGALYSISVDSSTSLEDLRDKINDKVGKKVTASILDTGGDTPFKLIVKSDKSGEDNAVSLSVDPSANMDMTFNNIQQAQDAELKYNGVTITRSENSIDDLVTGVTVDLLEENDPGKSSHVEIKQDLSGLTSKVEGFVQEYNALMNQLNELTKYDDETGEAGLFLGESTINRLKSDLSSIVTYTTSDRDSFLDYGVELQDNGTLTFESEDLEEALNGDIDKMQQFFIGSYEEIYGEERLVDGVFSQFSEKISDYTDFSLGYFRYFGEQLENEEKSLTAERKDAMEKLDQRYQIMAERFAAYDNQIANMNSSFNSLQMQIEQSLK